VEYCYRSRVELVVHITSSLGCHGILPVRSDDQMDTALANFESASVVVALYVVSES